MPHRQVPQRLIAPYVAYVVAGVLLTIYQPPTLQAFTSPPLLVVWNSMLLVGAVTALYGGTWRKEVPELAGLVSICGALIAYMLILAGAGISSDDSGRFASWGIAMLLLAGLLFGLPRAVALWVAVRREMRRHRSARL